MSLAEALLVSPEGLFWALFFTFALLSLAIYAATAEFWGGFF